MNTYDTGAGTHGSRPFLYSLKGWFTRFIDREREIISLRNAVGMMSEARRADAAEYDEMVKTLRVYRDTNRMLQERMMAAYPCPTE